MKCRYPFIVSIDNVASAVIVIILLLSLLIPAPAHAQEVISYGDSVTGLITEDLTATSYFFDGEQGDVIVIEMRSVNRTLENLLDAPRILLEDEAGNTLADTFLAFPVDDAFVVAQLPGDGRYRITATRDEGTTVASIGPYTLRLLLVPPLIPGETINATLSTEDVAHYYTIAAESAFSLVYQREGGAFGPQITVGQINAEANRLQDVVGVAYGRGVDTITMGTFAPEFTYLITLNQNAFDFYFEPAQARYTLRVLDDD